MANLNTAASRVARPSVNGPTKENAMSKETTIPSFNPSGSEVVAETKRLTEELMDYIRANVPENRHRSIAMTNYEQAAMWAVKANFV
mgnify:FL=1